MSMFRTEQLAVASSVLSCIPSLAVGLRDTQAVGASERVFQLMDRQPNMAPAGSQKPMGAAEGGEIEFRDVWCAACFCDTP